MRAATGPMHVVIGKEDRGLRLNTCSHAAFGRYAITSRLAFLSVMASDPLGSTGWRVAPARSEG